MPVHPDVRLRRATARYLCVCLIAVVSSAAAADLESSAVLDDLLTRLDRTAALYAQVALGFSCEETIRWQGRHDDGRRKFGYVVAVDDQGVFEDYRTLARKRKKSAMPKRVDPTDYGVPTYLRSAYLWVFVFTRDRWPHHRYEIVGEEELFDRTATLVRFEPIAPYRVGLNNWFGTAWIDNESAQLLKIDAHRPEDEAQLEKIAKHAAGEAVSDWVYVVEQITTEFTIVQRGLRFPGRVELRHDSYDFMRGLRSWNTATRTILWVHQVYSDYRFFSVEADAIVEPFVEPDRR